MENEYMKDKKLQDIMQATINKYPEFEHIKEARITCVAKHRSRVSRGKIVYADCTKITDKVKAVADCDFIITFYEDGLILDRQAMERLMYHELLHVGYDRETGRCSIVPHDLEDFKAVIRKWGADWVQNPEKR